MKRTVFVIALVVVAATAVGFTQTSRPEAGRNWASPLGDPGATKFSTLTQINTTNVKNLKRAWTFHTGSDRFAYPPMIVDSVMYFSAPNGVFALDAVTGKQLWRYPAEAPAPPAPPANPPAGAGAARAGGGGGGRGGRGGGVGTDVRGPIYWGGSKSVGPRIYSQMADGLAAIDAKTGQLVTTFGTAGYIAGARHNSPPVIYKDLIITRGENEGVKGNTVKAYDLVTGATRWTFYLKAQGGDPNAATWMNGSGATLATPGLWGTFSVDEARGLLFVPTDKPEGNGINDYWGGGAHGNNLYANSLLAIEAATGKLKWYQQLVHHDIWDYDLAAAPVLFDVRRNGRVIPAVAQANKMALLFTFNRETGEPIFGMEERPVPQTTIPGEWTSPTQPFPLKPGPLSRNTMTKAELAKVTPEHQKFCEDFWETNKLSDAVPYAAWKLDANVLNFPGAQGGSNWQGLTFNKTLGLLISNAMDAGQWGRMQAGGGRRGAPPPDEGVPAATGAQATPPPPSYSKTPGPTNRFWNNANMWSCSEPPWGQLVAVSANTGEIVWRVPLGEFEELTKKGIPPTGTPMSGGGISTAGNLVFIGATIDGYFRAFDARNGKELWRDKLPAPNQGMPSTYMGRDGKQYVVVGANGGGFFRAPTSDEVIAYVVK
ncbi:MAG: quinoprotein glucose dehydrogenase [Acidobacteria bacterium]|nr:MAG: quinoprotein glucose dehydrogenase [Acidobacteriota bacterium]